MTYAVELVNIGLTLDATSGKVKILEQVNLQLKQGESTALVGSSGSGKTSTLLVTAGLEAPTTGEVRILGEDVTHMREDDLAMLRRQYFGIVFQSFHLVPTMTALENVAIPLELSGVPDPYDISSQMLEQVGLSHRTSHYPSQLSGGEQQRVAIARAFATQPKIILADEPTGNLDHTNSQHIMQKLFELQKAHGVTLLLITHDESLAQQCDRTVTMKDGTIHG